MDHKAKQCPAKKRGHDEKVAAAPAAEGASSDGETGGTGTAAPGLPMANLVRLMRQAIPKSVKISSRAKDLTHDCAIEFVGFLPGEAAERATAQQRRTITPEDFTCSFQALGFDDYVKPMSTYINRYRDQVKPAGGYRGFARRHPLPPATVAPAVTPAPCDVSDEEAQRRVPRHGESDDGGSTSVHAPTPSAHTSPNNM